MATVSIHACAERSPERLHCLDDIHGAPDACEGRDRSAREDLSAVDTPGERMPAKSSWLDIEQNLGIRAVAFGRPILGSIGAQPVFVSLVVALLATSVYVVVYAFSRPTVVLAGRGS
ncbi:hypothetical protein [Rhodococcus sp. IC4_135]|uniref:hypothetical protein n=1 Tax=Rhodococcus sp. IC4_135 TaxID=2715537 RepID=UPI001981A326